MTPDLAGCRGALEDAVDAAGLLGIDAAEARDVAALARARLGLVADVYVLALVGGTGVGKSTLLNAIAGSEVSPASARRPTTERPRAWVPRARRAALGPLLEWLGVADVLEHAGDALADVAVLDLPDLDSVAREHRARVDELLPRVDAVAWVVDPEKYKDRVLHDAYLRRWTERLARQVVVLNRIDLVAPGERESLRDDLARELRVSGLPALPIVIASSRDGADGIAEVRRWLESEIEAKRVVAARVGAEVRAAVLELARRAGVADDAAAPIASPERRTSALRDVVRGVLGVVDVDGVSERAAAASRLVARRRGTGPMGLLTTLVYRWSGRAAAAADPVRYLRAWRRRGSLAPAVEPLRRLVADALPSVPGGLRPAVAALGDPAALEARLVEAVDAAVAEEAAAFVVARSALWPIVGAAQYVVTALLLFAALWFAALFVLHQPAVGSTEVPVLGPVPTPVLFLAAVLASGYLLALALRLHAGWLGRRWGRRVAARLRAAVEERVGAAVLVPLDGLEASRARIAAARRTAEAGCGDGG